MSHHDEFISKLTQYFQSSHSFLLAKGRVGLCATLKALKFQDSDEILLPGYTCLVVPTAVKILGIHCKYVDIDPHTYNLNLDHLESQFTNKTKALLVQHTYGIPCNMERICAWAHAQRIPIIEDCCLAFGSRYKQQLCGTFGVASYFSGQWNKPFSTGLGGMLIVNNSRLRDKIQDLVDTELIHPPLSHRMRIWLEMKLYEHFVTPTTVQTITRLYRRLSKTGVAVGSSTAGEYAGVIPKNYFMGMTPSQAKKGLLEMGKIEENINHRKTIVQYYEHELPKHGFACVSLDSSYDPVYVRYPVRVKNKDEVLEAAYAERVEIGSWFESPLHPAGTNLEQFDYMPGSCPKGERAAREVINLPTHTKITAREGERILRFLKKHAQPASV